MPARKVRVPTSDPELLAGLDRIRTELGIPESVPGPVVAAADAAIAHPRDLGARADLRAVPFVTIDPAGSRDLDQAFFAERVGTGARVRYAIADVAAFVATGDAVDAEAHARGVTVYLPDRRAPLYPERLGEGAASLLPDGDRPALCWTIDVDDTGVATAWRLERATVRSRRQMTYVQAQAELDAGTAEEPLVLLREVGRLREEQERARGGVSLPLPSQEVRVRPGGYELAYEAARPVEGWNAQISLLAGICAATTMVAGGVGILRTLPPPDERALGRLRRTARALGLVWPDAMSYPEMVHGLVPDDPAAEAFVEQAVETLRGAGYTLVDPSVAEPPVHGALATLYAHVTAPLRRLADRIANEIVVALTAGAAPSDEARAALVGLPELMRETGHRAAGAERAVVDLAEALVLRGREGERFPAVVVDRDDDRATVLVRSPAVIARVPAGTLELGASVEVRLRSVDPRARRVDFEVA